MNIIRENNRDRALDKNLQDDWIPDQERRAGATSSEIPEYGGDLKGKDTVAGLMSVNPIFCTSETRIAEIKHLIKKYDCDEILVLDSIKEKHPIGILDLADVSTALIEESAIPSDVSAIECMRSIPAVAHMDLSLGECLNIMRDNHMERIPIVDLNGHVQGVLEKKVITAMLFQPSSRGST